MEKVPVVARFDESMDRHDLGLNPARVEELKAWAHAWSFPAAQDAKRYDGAWHPFGADTEMFRPYCRCAEPKVLVSRDRGAWCEACGNSLNFKDGKNQSGKYRIGFVGSFYEMRAKYLRALAPLLPDDLTFHAGPCFVQDLDGVAAEASTSLLAENYAKLKIFFCLPPMSRLLVAKVFEVMATGTFLMYPRLPGDAGENLEIFQDGVHLAYYEPGNLKRNAAQIRSWLEQDAAREAIAKAGGELVRSRNTLRGMLECLVGMAGKKTEKYDADVPYRFENKPAAKSSSSVRIFVPPTSIERGRKKTMTDAETKESPAERYDAMHLIGGGEK
jgi:glycosyltransferase involved in cell wall biosynthesis